MINILPPEEKKKIITEYHSRVSVVVVGAITAVVFAAFILLIPAYLIVASKYNFSLNEEARLEEKRGNAQAEQRVDTQTKEINKDISLFIEGKGAPTHVPSEMILAILQNKSSNITISSISYSLNNTREQTALSGVARDRDSLAFFVDILKQNPFFSKVSLPIGSYVKNEDIDFLLTLEREISAPANKK